MNIAIVGSRSFGYLDMVKLHVQRIAAKYPDAVIISGGARGVDSAAEVAAKHHGLDTLIFPAEWDKYGKSAGFKRNRDIVEAADVVVGFWDGTSRGTKHSLDLALELGKPVFVLGVSGTLVPYAG